MYCERLKERNRTFRTMPGKLLLGPTGARLRADYLDPIPGFSGRIDFIHKMNIPLLFRMETEGDGPLTPPPEADWYPDRLDLRLQTGRYLVSESKWISWEDEAVSLQTWHNLSPLPLTLRRILPEGTACRDGILRWQPPVAIHGLQPVFLFGSPSWPDPARTLAPGEECRFTVIVLAALPEDEAAAAGRLRKLLSVSPATLRRRQRAACERWFEEVPSFSCSDPMLEKAWLYRWYILRACLAEPGTGNFRHRTMYEGCSHKMTKTPYRPSGWEFTKLVPLSTPFHIREMMWRHDRSDAAGILRTLPDSAEDGIWRCMFTDEKNQDYANCSAWSLYQYFLTTGDRALAEEMLPAFRENVLAVYAKHRGENDHLQIETVHQRTGKEYQPSYWYFAEEYPDHVGGDRREGYTPLKRVDRSVYMYLDLKGLSGLCRSLGDPEEGRFADLAEQLRRDILEKMWDPETEFFYDLHYRDDRKALVKNIVGYYPFWAGITDARHLGALRYLSDPRYFATGSGFASTAADCPVFSACGGWKGDFFKGRNGCVWNGPSWPYTTAVTLDAVAAVSRAENHRFDALFARGLQEYLLQHFRGHDLRSPYLVEHYDSITGEPLSDEPDYNHSFLIDLTVRCVAGLIPTEEGLLFEPVACGLDHFALRGVRIRERMFSVTLSDGIYTLEADRILCRLRPGECTTIPWKNTGGSPLQGSDAP